MKDNYDVNDMNKKVNSDNEVNNGNAVNNEKAVLKPQKHRKGLIIVLAVLLVLGVIFAFFWKPICNLAVKIGKTPKEYYSYVEKKNLENATENFYQFLKDYEEEKQEKTGAKYSVKLETGEGLSDVLVLAEIKGNAFDWFKGIELAGKINAASHIYQEDLQGFLNDKKLFDLSFLADWEKGKIYASLPVFTGEKYLEIDLEDMIGQSGISINLDSLGEDFTEKLPEKEVIQKLLLKYFDILIENIGEAKETKDALTIGNVTQSLTLITYEIDPLEFYTAQKALFEEAKSDEELKKVIEDLEEKDVIPVGTYIQFEKICENYTKQLDSAIDVLENKTKAELESETFTYEVWINSKGEAVARSFKSEGNKLFSGTVKDGRKFANEILVMTNGKETFNFSSEGEISFGKMSATHKLCADKKELFTIETEKVRINSKGELIGKVSLSLGRDVVENIVWDKDVRDYLEATRFVINSEKSKVTLSAEAKEKNIVKITAQIEEEKYVNPVYPSEDKVVNISDAEALSQMLENLDVQELLDALEEAGVPENVIEGIINGNASEDESSVEESSEESSEEGLDFDVSRWIKEYETEKSSDVTEIAGTYDVNIWVPEEATDFTQELINEFMGLYPDIVINANIEKVNEDMAYEKLLQDKSTAADMFFIDSEGIPTLVNKNALIKLYPSIVQNVDYYNTDSSANAAKVDRKMYAYPLSIEETLLLYYDKSVITQYQCSNFDKIIEICEEKNLKFRFDLDDPLYSSAFFIGTGCRSKWIFDENDRLSLLYDTYNSDYGLVALKMMKNLVKTPIYDKDIKNLSNTAVVVASSKDYSSMKKHFGKNLGIIELPEFKYEYKNYALSGFANYRCIGIKPQEDEKKEMVLSLLAFHMSHKESQIKFGKKLKWSPTQRHAQETHQLEQTEFTLALMAQANKSLPKIQFHKEYVNALKGIGTEVQKTLTINQLNEILNEYEEKLRHVFAITPDNASWGVYGYMGGKYLDEGFPMTKKSDTVWESDVLALEWGTRVRVRHNSYTDVSFGDAFIGNDISPNWDGNYIIRFTWTGNIHGKVELIKLD